MAACVALHRQHRDPGAEINTGLALYLGGDAADHSAQWTAQRVWAAFSDGYLKLEVTAHRGDFRTDEA